MGEFVDIDSLKGGQRAEDMRRLRASEVGPEELWRENSIWSLGTVEADPELKGSNESWERIIRNLQDN
jgi:hypothetical protein